MNTPAQIRSTMIAPCGMNCALCYGHIREKNTCGGCNGIDESNRKHRATCRIRNCERIQEAKPRFCFSCEKLPCTRLKQLDKRYRLKYGMSMIENLKHIEEKGMREFIRSEKKRWKCPQCGRTLCVHRDACVFCGTKR